jgi:hypothetical protein
LCFELAYEEVSAYFGLGNEECRVWDSEIMVEDCGLRVWGERMRA